MSRFVKSIKIEREFEGDRVTFVARPMSKEAFIKVRQFAPNAERAEAGLGEDGSAFILASFVEHVDSVSGLCDAAGSPLSKEEVLSAAYFTVLVVEAAAEWSHKSIPENSPGNSEPSAR